MGYTTEFEGHVTIEPPLNAVEIEYLRRFAGSRRMHRQAGPYFAEDDGSYGQSDRGGVIDFNRRQVEALLRVVERHVPEPGQHPDFCGYDRHQMPCPDIRDLAAGEGIEVGDG